jgi:hypothetical protein
VEDADKADDAPEISPASMHGFTVKNNTNQILEFVRPARKLAVSADGCGSEGNSPQFVEKAGIFRKCTQQWNEAICFHHGHEKCDGI